MANKNEIKFEQPSDLLILANRYVIVIMSILVFAILMLGYFFLLKPKMVSNEARQELNSKNAMNQEASERLLDSLAKLETEYKNIQTNRQTDLEQLKKIIPDNPQIAELFVLADKLAKDNGLFLNSVNIANTAESQTNNDSSVLKSMSLHFAVTRLTVDELRDMYPDNTWPVDPSVDDYTLFKKYIATLEDNLRLMDIQSLTLPSLSAAEGHSMPSFNFSVITYYR